jgi:hypothetical protein
MMGAEAARAGTRVRSSVSWWLLALCLTLLAACSGRARDAARGDLLFGLTPSKVSGVACVECLTDGTAAAPGDAWESNLAARFSNDDSFVVYDLGRSTPITALWLQGDHNDEYSVLLSDDGDVFEQIWTAPRVGAAGMRDRSVRDLNVSGRYLRVEAARGDRRFALSEIMAFEQTPALFPPEPPRRRGLPIEIGVRTKLLTLGTALVLWLWLTSRRTPLWWVLVSAVLPILAALDALTAIADAWPVEQRQVSLVRGVVAVVAAAALFREVFAPRRWPAQRAVVLTSLGVTALAGVLAFYNLGRPQFWDHQNNRPTPIHVLDLRQYYQTVKYFDELGYRDMFLADIAAYVEDVPGATLDNMRDTPMRDLYSHRMSTVGEQRAKIEVIKQRFSPERWQQYKKDAAYFRSLMGRSDYLRYMFDYGSNATPVWMSVAHLMFSAFDASNTGLLLTGLLDPLLFLIGFVAIWLCFGIRTMCVVMVVFGANDFIMYGTNWGGSTLRHDWLVFLALGACALKKERWALGGVLFALATSIRAFPVLALVGAALPGLWWLAERTKSARRLPRWRELRSEQGPLLRVLGAAMITGVALLLVTSLEWSFATWRDWLLKVGRLSADAHGNSIALRGLIAGPDWSHDEVLRERWPLFALAMAAYVAMVFVAARGKTLAQASILGLSLVPVVFYPANYYIHIVCLYPLLVIERPTSLFGKPLGGTGETSLATRDAWLWLTLLALCAAQYFTVLVADLGLHFYLATVLLFVAYTLLLSILLWSDARAGGGVRASPAGALLDGPEPTVRSEAA